MRLIWNCIECSAENTNLKYCDSCVRKIVEKYGKPHHTKAICLYEREEKA